MFRIAPHYFLLVSVCFGVSSVILLLALHLCLFTMIGMLLFVKTEVRAPHATVTHSSRLSSDVPRPVADLSQT